MPAKILNIWRRAMPETRFTNIYGPSEATVDSSCYIVDRPIDDSESVPIAGIFCRNSAMFLMDEKGALAAAGEPGEIYIRGVNVGLGYYANPELTKEAFIQNPLHDDYRDIVYKTGDIAKMNELGEMVYISRIDGQIKHMGSRVELGEIEAAAAALDGVDALFCSFDKARGKILLFYEGDADSKALASSLARRLPRYMLPSDIIRIDKMPRLPNDKIDRIRARKEYYDDVGK